jgi:hypothetical protein
MAADVLVGTRLLRRHDRPVAPERRAQDAELAPSDMVAAEAFVGRVVRRLPDECLVQSIQARTLGPRHLVP